MIRTVNASMLGWNFSTPLLTDCADTTSSSLWPNAETLLTESSILVLSSAAGALGVTATLGVGVAEELALSVATTALTLATLTAEVVVLMSSAVVIVLVATGVVVVLVATGVVVVTLATVVVVVVGFLVVVVVDFLVVVVVVIFLVVVVLDPELGPL